MVVPSSSTKKRLLFAFLVVVLLSFFLILRLGYIQLVQGEELKKGALEQWTKSIEIKARRDTI